MSFIAATARWILLFSSILAVSCAGPAPANDSRGQFGIVTSEGMVLANVEGSATGFTNTELTHLIRTGVAEAYVIHGDVLSDPATAEPRMFWHVINDGRKPTTIISTHLVEGGKITSSAFTDVAAPDSNPDTVFIDAVSQLAQRVLPPAAKHLASSRTERS